MVNLMKVKMNIPKIVIWKQASPHQYSPSSPGTTQHYPLYLSKLNKLKPSESLSSALSATKIGAGGHKNIPFSSWFIV